MPAMMPQNVSRAVAKGPSMSQIFPPKFLLPIRAYLSSSASSTTSTTPSPPEPRFRRPAKERWIPSVPRAPPSAPTRYHRQLLKRRAAASHTPPAPISASILAPDPERVHLPPAPPAATGPIPGAVAAQLPLLAAQRPHHAAVHVHAHPYLVTEGDVVRLPGRLRGVAPGDVLRLTRASLLGSRDWTLRGAPYVDPRLFACRAVVVGEEAEPLRIKEKTKRRNRRVKRVKSKHRYTELVIRELRVRSDVEGLEVEAPAGAREGFEKENDHMVPS